MTITRTQLIFTTSEVALLIGVSPRQVSKWFDSGRLRGYRIPGSRDRRIPRMSLDRFLDENQLPSFDRFMANLEAVW